MKELTHELKTLIITTLNLEDYRPEDIRDDEPLFFDGLGLDSIDALELGVALQKKYGVTFKGGTKENIEHFRSIQTIAAFIQASSKPTASN